MTTVSFRNFLCVAGLFVGAAMITGADFARADTRSCTEDERGQILAEETLPVLCEVMTVTTSRPELASQRPSRFDFTSLFPEEAFRRQAADQAENNLLRIDVVS